MIVLMKMKKIILKHLLKPLLIPKENGLGILDIALKTIILNLKTCDYCSRLMFKVTVQDCYFCLRHYSTCFYCSRLTLSLFKIGATLQYLLLLFKIDVFLFADCIMLRKICFHYLLS
jgi:glutaredoxin